jgi:potassium voltage-gated channel Eag-related subfamily H protein 7
MAKGDTAESDGPVDLSALEDKLSETDSGANSAEGNVAKAKKLGANAIEKANKARQALKRGSYAVVKPNDDRLPTGAGWLNRGFFANIPVFLPEDACIHQMELLMMIALFYTAFFTTYQVAFGTVDAMCNSQEVFVVDFVVMLFFFLDVLIKFNLAYVSPVDGLNVTNRQKIVTKYMRGWFLADFMSTFPWDMVISVGSSPRLIRLLRLAKLMRLVRASRLIITVMKESNFKMSTWSFYKTTLLVIVVSHWVSCIWMMLGQIDEDEGWMSQYYCHEDEDCWDSLYGTNETLLDGRLLKGGGASGGSGTKKLMLTSKSWYFLCLEFTLAALNVWPYDDIPYPITKVEQYVSVLTIFMSATIYAYLAGVVVELVSRQGERTREVDGIFDALVEYMDGKYLRNS